VHDERFPSGKLMWPEILPSVFFGSENVRSQQAPRLTSSSPSPA
jgi:hypothetical protein